MTEPVRNILLLDKPASWTSFDVVAKTRGKLRAAYKQADLTPTKRQLKVGHAGTLDPFATGLLILLLGEATKQADNFLKLDKEYQALIRLGEVSTTADPEGEISQFSDKVPTIEEVKAALTRFQGQIEQTPPIFSAIKVNGQRAYKLARQGQAIELAKRSVVIYQLELVDYNYPELKVRAKVSSGTYIRSLAVDIGEELQTGAYCQQLKRTAIGDYQLAAAKRLETIDNQDLLTLA